MCLQTQVSKIRFNLLLLYHLHQKIVSLVPIAVFSIMSLITFQYLEITLVPRSEM